MAREKNHLNRIRVQASLFLVLNYFALSLLNSETGIYFFIMCCISAYLPRTEADTIAWDIVLDNLNMIKKLAEGIDAKLYTATSGDAKLYTARLDPDVCSESMLRCFLEELKVIAHECRDENKEETHKYVNFVNINIGHRLKESFYNDVPKGCKQCEQFQEENFTTFMERFTQLVQRFNMEKRDFRTKSPSRTASALIRTENSKSAAPDPEKTISQNTSN
ncbi:interleukin-15 isoform X2 [Microcaecilia unicolor]|uniref:Interleukin n=1 Tax=Microcaecilia unicolor TaxID=1415580 RepID=A0A6P7X2F9_9AMPH|nr:interleukin-15 isoform X2 [Microcaecilia unicolor]